MGIYSQNSHIATNNIQVEAAEGYEGNVGFARILTENMTNERILFESLIANDFKEVALGESATDEQVIELLEASSTGFFGKIIELVKKLWAKIKGLISAFIKKIVQIISVDNKAYVLKTKAEVLAKDCSKMEYKFRVPKLSSKRWNDLGYAQTGPDSSPQKLFDVSFRGTLDAINDAITKIASEDGKIDLVKRLFGLSINDMSDFKTEYTDALFEDEDDIEGLEDDRKREIIETLTNGKKAIKNLNKIQSDSDTYFKKQIKELTNVENQAAKLIPDGGKFGVNIKDHSKDPKDVDTDKENSKTKERTAEDIQRMSKAATLVKTTFQSGQFVTNQALSTVLEATKFHIKQSRKVWNRAVMFNPKSVKENALLVEGADDVAAYDLELAWGPMYD